MPTPEAMARVYPQAAPCLLVIGSDTVTVYQGLNGHGTVAGKPYVGYATDAFVSASRRGPGLSFRSTGFDSTAWAEHLTILRTVRRLQVGVPAPAP